MKDMPQLTVCIQDVSMLDQIRRAISLLRGVTSITVKRQTKTVMDRSIGNVKKGRVYEVLAMNNSVRLPIHHQEAGIFKTNKYKSR